MGKRPPVIVAILLAAVHFAVSSTLAQKAAPSCRDDAMLVFDASGSMAGTDLNTPPTPRIARVKEALAKVLPHVAAGRNIGLIDYGPGPANQCNNIDLLLRPAPHAAERIMAAVDKLIPAGRTPLTEAVREAARVLQFPQKPGVVVLLTDGEETCGGDPCEMAHALRAQGENLTVHVIGFALDTGFSHCVLAHGAMADQGCHIQAQWLLLQCVEKFAVCRPRPRNTRLQTLTRHVLNTHEGAD